MQKPLSFNVLSPQKMLSGSREFLETIFQRRSVRDFSDNTVDYEIIENAVRAAASAPSGANKQPWHFVIVANPFFFRQIAFLILSLEHIF